VAADHSSDLGATLAATWLADGSGGDPRTSSNSDTGRGGLLDRLVAVEQIAVGPSYRG